MTDRSFTKDKSTGCEPAVACAANDVKGKVQEMASSVTQQVQDVASKVSNKAHDWAGNVADRAHESAAAVNDGIAVVGQRMNALGGTVRDAGPRSGAFGPAASAVADELQAGGHYLEAHDLKDIGKDLTDVVRRYPIQSVLAGFGIGCLIGMTLLRSRS